MQRGIKRLLALVLVLALVVSLFPAAIAADRKSTVIPVSDCTVSVLESAPTAITVTAGAMGILALSEVFTDSESHAMTYTFESEVTNEHTKIVDGSFYFTANEAGTYKVTLSAVCAQGVTASHTITYTVEPASKGSDSQYGYDETPASKVTVYVTISNDGTPVQGADGTVLSHLPVTVPYFDLSLYGLESYYRYQTEGGQGEYINDTIVERPTGLHLYIYLLERYYMGLSEEQCCKGTSGVLSFNEDTSVYYMDSQLAYTSGGKNALSISGSATSLYMVNFWGHDENLMYYRNHCYPYMSPGWGATSDYILLSDGDTWDVAMFTNWSFYHSGYFACFDQDTYSVDTGASLTVKTQAWGTTSVATDFVAKNGLNVGLYDQNWKLVKTLSYDTADGNSLTFTAPDTMGTYYLMAIDPNTRTENAAIAPATAMVEVKGDPYANYLFNNIYYEDADGNAIQLTQVTEMGGLNGTDGMGNEYVNLPAYQIGIPESMLTTGLTVNMVFPTSQSMLPYALSYDPTNGFGYNAPNMTLTDNGDDTQTITIPVSTDFIGTGAYIVLEDGNYQGFMGFTFGKVSTDSRVAVTGVTLDKTELTMNRWSTETLTATVAPENATNKRVTWTSSDTSVATVDANGVITAISAGDTEITVTTSDSGFTAKCAVTVTDPDRPEQEEDGTFLIANAANLRWFAREVNSGNSAASAKLTADIDLSTVCGETLGTWTPIGDYSNGGKTFAGTFDGCNHTISNLYIFEDNASYTNTSNYYRGLFGCCNGATIKNLTLNGSVISNNRYVAALVGCAKGGTVIENCHNYATVTCSQKTNEWGYAGIVASLTASTVRNCSNHGMISGSCGRTAGVVADLSGVCTVSGCVNTAEIYCLNFTKAFNGTGGIVGYAKGSAETVITDCYNTGKVWQYFQTMAYDLHIGGILGHAGSAVAITNCYNTGVVTCSGKCLESATMGAILGGIDSDVPTITNCYYLDGGCVPGKNDTASSAKTDAEMKATAFAKTMGEAWQASCNSCPVLTWQTAVAHTNEDGDKSCDVCGAVINAVPTLIAGVDKALTVKIQTGHSYQLDDLMGGKIFEDTDGDTLTYQNYFYRKSSDGGETWGELTGFSALEHGGINSSLSNSTEGIYLYRFWAYDGYGYSDDTWTLTLQVMDVVPADVNFYVGRDQNYSAHSTYPVLELYRTAGIDDNFFDYVGWFTNAAGEKEYVYNPADYEIVDGEETDYVVVEGEQYTLYDYEKIAFTNSAFDNSDETATASGTVVGNYNMFYASIESGRYSTRAYGYNSATEKYDVYLGGQSMELPMEKDIYGGGGGDIYLRVVSGYTSSKKTDGTYFTADDYYVQMIMPVTGSMIHAGDPYVSGNYTYYPFLSYAAGNASLYNIYAYPYDTDSYIFSQSINNTTSAGYSVVNKSVTINTAVKLTVTVPADAQFDLYFQYNNFNTKAVDPMAEAVVDEENGTKTITYKISKGNANYTWRLTDPSGVYVTKAGWLSSLSADSEKTYTFSSGDATDKTTHDFSGLGRTVSTRDEADIQVFLAHSGFMSTSETYRVRAFRMWQLINSDTANIMLEPDFNVQVLQGNAGDVTQVDGGNAAGNWIDVKPTTTDIIAVTYDAIDVYSTADDHGTHGGLFPATNPERAGVFVITNETAGTADAAVRFNGSMDTDRGTEWDYNYDTWYYLNTDTAPTLDFTVSGAGDVTVSFAMVITDAGLKSTLTSWTAVSADADGNYHADLLAFRNAGALGGTVIIKMTDSTGTSYRLVRVAEMTATVTNTSNPDEPFMPGDDVSITFSGLYRSVNKVAGIFNPLTYYQRYTSGSTEVNGKLGQYQQMDRASITLTIPEDLEFPEGESSIDYTFTNGYIYGSMYSASSPFDTLYNMTDTGVGTNFSAVGVSFVLSRMADIPLTVTEKVYYDVKINVTDGTDTLSGYTLTLTDPDGNVLTPDENGIYQDLPYGEYDYQIALVGYICQVGSVRLGSADAENVTDGILTRTLTMTKAAENAWDGITATEPKTDENGVYQISTGAELAWFAQTVNAGTTGISAVLTADIDLAAYNWTPIGDSTNKFTGSFDGQEHEIRNFYISTTTGETYRALFGYTSGATLSNFRISGVMTMTSANSVGSAYSAGVAGLASGGSITNVHADVDITITRVKGNWARVGGIVGSASGSLTITNCSNTGDIVGYQYVGGITGYSAPATITGCSNSGNLTGYQYVGGISASGAPVTIIGCYNVGELTCTNNYVGGISSNISSTSVLTNCFNAGKVTFGGTTAYAGAVVGYANNANGTNASLYYLEGTYSTGIGINKNTAYAAAVSAETLASAEFVSTINTGLEEDAFIAGETHPILVWQSNGTPAIAYGDLDGDNKVSATDAALLYRYTNGKIELTEEQLILADVNGDGKVNSVDAALIYRYVSGKITKFPAEG